MERKKASDFPQELLNLLDRYVHGDITPRYDEAAAKLASARSTGSTNI
jgi:carboxymethylenebutenolidase